jgi:hypothetical protein
MKAGNPDLSTMRVAGELNVDPIAGGFVGIVGLMYQQDFGIGFGHTGESLIQSRFSKQCVVHAKQPQVAPIPFD